MALPRVHISFMLPMRPASPRTAWPSGFTALPLAGGVHGAVYAMSADGGTAVGSVDVSGATRACYWTAAAGPITVGPSGSEAFGVSSDGSVIVGYQSGSLWRWTASGGLVAFGTANDTVLGLSADGSRAVGSVLISGVQQACYWNAAGTRTNLGYLPGHDVSWAQAVSADGSFIAGTSYLSTDNPHSMRAWRWTSGGGMVSVGVVGTAVGSRGFGVSDDGGVVVGGLLNALSAGVGAFQWSPGGGMVQETALTIATGVSGNGSTVIADSLFPAAGTSSYFAYSTAAGITVPDPTSNPTDPTGANGTYPTGLSTDGTTIAGYSFGAHPLPWVYVGDSPTPPDPPPPCVLYLDWSNDRGHTFGTPVGNDMNPQGYLTSLQWQRLGMARDRVFRLTWTCDEHTALQGAWVEVEVGDEDNEMAGQGSG